MLVTKSINGTKLISKNIIGGMNKNFQLTKKTTSLLWNQNKRFISLKRHNFGSSSNKDGNILNAQPDSRIVNWVVVTGVTLVLGSFIINNVRGEVELKNGEDNKKSQSKIRIFDNNWLFFCYSTLPLNAISRLWGQFNSLTLPVWLRPWSFKLYSSLFGANLDEMLDPNLENYENLSQFFYREIKPESRPIDFGENVIVCPSDGKVLQLGIINADTGEIEQVKGLTYSVKEFLGTHSNSLLGTNESQELVVDHNDEKYNKLLHNTFLTAPNLKHNEIPIDMMHTDKSNFIKKENISPDHFIPASKTSKLLGELSTHYVKRDLSLQDPSHTQLYFAVIYLAPGDYHHYHSPVNWICKLRRHFPGELFSVAPYFQRNFPNLFILNERVALLGHWKYGFFSMTPVGATNVGSIKLNFDKQLVTNLRKHKTNGHHKCYETTYKTVNSVFDGVPLLKGEEMGGFMLGSTVVLCFEAPRDFKFKINIGDIVKMGQPLGESN